ncbi:hypothetical protein VY86_19860 [Photorhabdus thracensis]|uniref:Glyoxalase/fosfomycin resistance/dioxygenase domain-containing protein n=1 Tax=Photorhabdus thracensis TaxID=230089 RepID=A0A0F7LPU2_9GAMM|nr:hypothetical protein VY86_19860 [Photorhabdus thracensis]
MKPIALLIHVPNVKAGLDWYKKAFPEARSVYLEEFDFTVLKINGFSLEIVQADDKVGAGKKGTVMYWSVPDLKDAIEHFQQLGANLYRGPMAIEDGLGMCQVEDPFGNLIGLRGNYMLSHDIST